MQEMAIPIRKECPPGACTCERELLDADPSRDCRILQLTAAEEKKLLARIESVTDHAGLMRLAQKMQDMLGMELSITPSDRGVRTVHGFNIQLMARPGLCRKTRQAVPAAVRKCLENNPAIAYAILDAQDLFGTETAVPQIVDMPAAPATLAGSVEQVEQVEHFDTVDPGRQSSILDKSSLSGVSFVPDRINPADPEKTSGSGSQE